MQRVNELLSASYLLTQLALTYLGDAADEAEKQGKAFRFDLKQEAAKAERSLDRIRSVLAGGIPETKAKEFLKDYEDLEKLVTAYLNVNRDKSITTILYDMAYKFQQESDQQKVNSLFDGVAISEAIKKVGAPPACYLPDVMLSSKLEEIAKAEGYQTEIIGATTIARLGGSSVPYTEFTFVVSKDSRRFETYRNKTVTGFVAGRVSANLRKIFIKAI